MKRHSRGGFTLAELMVVAVLGTLIAAAALQILITNQRAYTAQGAAISGQQSTRMALEVLFSELREVSAAGGDLLVMGGDSIRVRLMRRFSYVCETDFSGQPELIVRNLGGRKFAAGDSVFVYADNDEGNTNDDAWIEARVSAIDSTDQCPQDSTAATELTFNGQSSLFSADSVGVGAPVRSYEKFTFGVTTLLGDPFLARRSGSDATFVPIAGPLAASNGLTFAYLDRFGNTTTNPLNVRQIVVTIRTGSGVMNSLGRPVSDSITAWIYTRN